MAEPPPVRALTLAAIAPDDTAIDIADLPIGDRDARLLSLREAVFGDTLESLADCTACGETMELSFKAGDVRATGNPVARAPIVDGPYRVEWRQPTGGDLAALAPGPGPDETGARLLGCCVIRAESGDETVDPADLPEQVRAALARAVEQADAQADVELTMNCPACARVNVVPFDIAAFFWDELNAWACCALQDVHELASAYAWTERDVLAMSSFRPEIYLEMLGA